MSDALETNPLAKITIPLSPLALISKLCSFDGEQTHIRLAPMADTLLYPAADLTRQQNTLAKHLQPAIAPVAEIPGLKLPTAPTPY